MAPRLVFVHGIGGRRDAVTQRAAWTAALAEGARRAGHARFAAGLADGSADVDTVFANYSELFAAPGAQGGPSIDGLDEAGVALLDELLDELVGEQLVQPDHPEARAVFEMAARELRPAGDAQGAGDIARRLLDAATTILSFGPLARSGQWAGDRLMLRDLAQVVRYLSRAEEVNGRTLDQRIRAIVHAAIGAHEAVVVAHSLGSVVAFETLHEPGPSVPLLVTLGSPLAMRTVVRPRLRPQPPTVPDRAGSWLNCWDRDDLIVARPALEASFRPNAAGVRPESRRVDSDGAWVHTATKYLAHPEVGGRVAEALQESARATAP